MSEQSFPYFIAEVSSNHHQSLSRCKEFIDVASRIGCDAVKFQLFKIDQLFAPEILKVSEEHRSRKQWELPLEFLPDLSSYCVAKKIHFSCTPFYLKAVDELDPFVSFFKIASYELLWDELIIKCAKTNKPLILSTGMATLDEIINAVSVARRAGCENLTVLHCVSSYPASPESCNLAAIDTLRRALGCRIGWSDHSVSSAVLQRALNKWGADTIEFHLDLDGKGDEFSSGHCWLPEQIEKVIFDSRIAFQSDGSGEKVPVDSEISDRQWRADPLDGLRPLRCIRDSWSQ